MLSIGKPIIVYKCGAFSEKVFNYGEKIFASNYEEISKKINLIIQDYNRFNAELDKDRSKLFFKREPGKLNRELNQILNES